MITVFGDLTKMSVFDATGIETQDPLLLVRTFAHHKAIAVRAFEISQSNRSDTPEVNWLRAEQELLGSSKTGAALSWPGSIEEPQEVLLNQN